MIWYFMKDEIHTKTDPVFDEITRAYITLVLRILRLILKLRPR